MAEVQYPSNSNKSKQKQQSVPAKGVSSSVSGSVQMNQSKQDKFMKAIFAEDIKGGLKELFWKKALPRAKGAAMNSMHDALNTIFNMPGGGSGSSNGQYNYNAQYNYNYPGQSVAVNSNTQYRQITGYPKASDLIFSAPDPEVAKMDANNALQFLKDQIEECGFVTVNTLYGFLGRSIESVWANYGWINVDTATIIQQGNSFILKLPKASPINNV